MLRQDAWCNGGMDIMPLRLQRRRSGQCIIIKFKAAGCILYRPRLSTLVDHLAFKGMVRTIYYILSYLIMQNLGVGVSIMLDRAIWGE
jgi:hypothetical protein